MDDATGEGAAEPGWIVSVMDGGGSGESLSVLTLSCDSSGSLGQKKRRHWGRHIPASGHGGTLGSDAMLRSVEVRVPASVMLSSVAAMLTSKPPPSCEGQQAYRSNRQISPRVTATYAQQEQQANATKITIRGTRTLRYRGQDS
jgi:hypothetical protein